MRTYILTGDINHAGRVEVEADSLEEALSKADDGDFEVLDEDGKNLGFDFCGDTEGGVEIVEE
jgi:hypothetical protein